LNNKFPRRQFGACFLPKTPRSVLSSLPSFSQFNKIGPANTANGTSALMNNTKGNNNTALGASAGANLTTGNNNIANVLGTAGECGKIRRLLSATKRRSIQRAFRNSV
jgi:hypothetical protein